MAVAAPIPAVPLAIGGNKSAPMPIGATPPMAMGATPIRVDQKLQEIRSEVSQASHGALSVLMSRGYRLLSICLGPDGLAWRHVLQAPPGKSVRTFQEGPVDRTDLPLMGLWGFSA
eukprot:NODE_3736_length_888_cov_44.711561_g3108_i0.p1 GENE.NODE_3736_length_888_cov_44.711561_g3108_i0~~NODE_3736_length_888_cov_44.711561_g3108_i0.p1  ORF type:complete len:116 (-),score=5.76 NODE_3736_length_888_cov_44.711561_g3108_i0:405-752(-)